MYEIDEFEYQWLIGYVKTNKIQNVIEFGPGRSTEAFMEANAFWLISYEFNREHYERIKNDKRYRFADVRFCDGLVPNVIDPCDMVFVDAPFGGSKQLARLDVVRWGLELCGHVLLHDAARNDESEIIHLMNQHYSGSLSVDMFEYGRKTAILRVV